MNENEVWVYKAGTSGTATWKRRGLPDLPPYAPPVVPPAPPPTDPGTPVVPGAVTNPELPFELEPLRAAMGSSAREVYAHWFPPYPMSIDNATALGLPGATTGDYYDRNWLPISGEGGVHASYGGLFRDRPLGRVARPEASPEWQILDNLLDCRRAQRMGLDGFTLEILGIGTSANGLRCKNMVTAVERLNDPNFKLIAMPDGNGNGTADPVALGNWLGPLLKSPAFKRLPDGRVLCSAFGPEKVPVGAATNQLAFWQSVTDTIATFGVQVAWWWCYVQQWTYTGSVNTVSYIPGAADKLDDIAYGHGRWGDRDPVSNRANTVNIAQAVSTSEARYGKPFMAAVSIQDTRPNSANHVYWEARNSDNLRASWETAIGTGAQLVQIPTWSDYSEHAHIAPSPNHGWTWGDINAYYMARYKLGYYPTITRDAIFLSHRIQPTTGVTYTGGQTLFQSFRGATPQTNEVEALVFATSPTGTLNLTSGGITTSFDLATATPVPGGLFSFRVPLRVGTAGQTRAELVRGGSAVATVTSKWAVSTTQDNEDLQYRCVGSLPVGVRP